MFVAVSSVQGMGPPATVTPGRLLASPVSPLKGRTDWLLSPSTTTRWPAPGGVLLLLLLVVVVVVVVCGVLCGGGCGGGSSSVSG